MDNLFNILSSSARIDKSKRPKRRRDNQSQERPHNSLTTPSKKASDNAKYQQEQIAAFRRCMGIKVANKHDPELKAPVSSFDEIEAPDWWTKFESEIFGGVRSAILRNVEAGRWKEPTPIQMQSIPSLMERRDVLACAPTGSGKSGAFLIPALVLASAPDHVFYNTKETPRAKKRKKKLAETARKGDIRCLILAPSLELASQLHRESQRLGTGKPGGLSSFLLTKANAPQVIAGNAGGKGGLDILISTPLRVIDALSKGLRMDKVRFVVLDEADRLLETSDGKNAREESIHQSSSRSFLSQMDAILSQLPSTAIRGLFSATVTPFLREMTESILRDPVDITVSRGKNPGGANPDIKQELMFVGREQGKILAIRQLIQRGQLSPPALVFLQSQERAQALFRELLHDGVHVDVIHAGRSKSARERAVAKFRKGDTWVLICTDLCARGVDFQAVKMVINYDLPSSGITYVHRIGRTGRAGRKGSSITFFTEADFANLRAIANIMKQSGCEVEDWMLNISRKHKKKH